MQDGKASDMQTGHTEEILDDTSCITLIQEYLLFKQLKRTCQELREECKEQGLSCPQTDDGMATSMNVEDAQNIMTTLNSEDFLSFFQAWNSKVPAAARAADPEARRLLFLCHVAAATRPANTDVHEGLECLKQYFLELGPQPFTREAELLHYFALPYVTDPHSHPAFQHLYKETWWTELRASVGSFVRRYTRGDTGPRLPLLRLGHCGPGVQQQQLKRRCRQLQNDYHRLLGVAGELTAALESAVKGDTLDLEVTLKNCTSIFPELFPSTNTRTSPEAVLRRSLQQKSSMMSLQNAAELELDYRKVRAQLTSPQNIKTRLLLMQALRWRISRSTPEERDLTVSALVRHDVLGLRGGFCVVTLLTAPDGDTPHPLQQGTARLMNALASLRAGRDYLSTPPVEQVVGVASGCLTGARLGVKIDDATSDMLLAMLQKLSLRRIHRETMISAGLVEWLVPRLESALDTLKLKPDGSTYALEYATALLMNLCLHSRAKQRCVPLSGRTLQLLSTMLGTAPLQALPYVNGALYSLLCEPLINQQARHMGLDKLLTFYLKQSEGELSRQLEHILGLLRGSRGPSDILETHSEDEGEADIASSVENVEEEVDFGDPVRASSELTGEELLRSQYKALFPARGPASQPTQSQQMLQVLHSQQQPRLSTPLPQAELQASVTSTEVKKTKQNRNIKEGVAIAKTAGHKKRKENVKMSNKSPSPSVSLSEQDISTSAMTSLDSNVMLPAALDILKTQSEHSDMTTSNIGGEESDKLEQSNVTSEQPAEQPDSTSKQLEKILEQPEKILEQPEKMDQLDTISEQPDTMSEQPNTISEQPDTISEQLDMTPEQPVTTSKQPDLTSQTVKETSMTSQNTTKQSKMTSQTLSQESTTSMPLDLSKSITSIPSDSLVSIGGRILDAQLADDMGSMLSLGVDEVKLRGEQTVKEQTSEESNADSVISEKNAADGAAFSPKPLLARTPPPSRGSVDSS